MLAWFLWLQRHVIKVDPRCTREVWFHEMAICGQWRRRIRLRGDFVGRLCHVNGSVMGLLKYKILFRTQDICVISWCLWCYSLYFGQYSDTMWLTGPRSTVWNVPDCRYVSDCRSTGREFDRGPVPYVRGDWLHRISKQGYRYRYNRKAFSTFYHRHSVWYSKTCLKRPLKRSPQNNYGFLFNCTTVGQAWLNGDPDLKLSVG